MSTVPPVPVAPAVEDLGQFRQIRHPLGLPAGSVRAALVLLIVVPVWVMLLAPHPDGVLKVPLFWYFMVGLVFLFFTSHAHVTVGGVVQQHPWGMPAGVFRWFIFVGTAAVIGYRFWADPATLREQLTPRPEELAAWPSLLLALVGGFAVGWLSRHGPWATVAVFQDVQAWVSILGMVGVVAVTLIHLFINPSLKTRLDLTLVESIVLAIVAFYFGSRS